MPTSREQLERDLIVNAYAMSGVIIPFEADAEGRQDLAPTVEMDGLAIHEDTVKIEEDGIKCGHGLGKDQERRILSGHPLGYHGLSVVV